LDRHDEVLAGVAIGSSVRGQVKEDVEVVRNGKTEVEGAETVRR
jgi:hypothetical protein